MVNISDMTIDTISELAFAEEKFKELERARKKKLFLMKILLK